VAHASSSSTTGALLDRSAAIGEEVTPTNVIVVAARVVFGPNTVSVFAVVVVKVEMGVVRAEHVLSAARKVLEHVGRVG
jgi:hypothetical protein